MEKSSQMEERDAQERSEKRVRESKERTGVSYSTSKRARVG